MKILNIALNGVYTDGLSYHENLLPKYHKKNGHEVSVITSEFVFNNKGEAVKTTGPKDYIDEEGVHIYRLHIKNDKDINCRLKRFEGLYPLMDQIKPDIIFCHLFQFLDVLQVIKYKKRHPKVKLFIDSHADYSNSAHSWLSKHILHGILWRYCAQKALPYTERFYGVLPARVELLKERYHVPENMVELLVMGADDEMLELAKATVAQTRTFYGIAPTDKLIVTGGKIDLWKQQTLLLMDAVNAIEDKNVKLIVFGSVVEELREAVNQKCSEKVQYIGWLNSEASYRLFASCDLAVFPGRHSVFWEQVAGQGIPMVVKHWDGTTHVDCGGNVKFLTQDSTDEIKAVIEEVFTDDNHVKMLEAAKKASAKFMYSELAKRSIEL